MTKAYLSILFIYVFSAIAVIFFGDLLPFEDPVCVAALADLGATILIFAFSLLYNNSSVYDPYWSVAPVFIAVYWFLSGVILWNFDIRALMVLFLLLIWSVRLTVNWLIRWKGLGDEDWRYRDFRQKTGNAYWLVSFLGIHLMPTILVFLGCMSLIPVFMEAGDSPGFLDIVALVVTVLSIWIETIADRQLRQFKLGRDNKDKILKTGFWAISRHPNYLGEITFWWGLYLFGLAANASFWWTIIGPIAITVLFIFISIPMLEKRMNKLRPSYKEETRDIPRFLLWF